MSSLADHNRAMEFCDLGDAAKRQGDWQTAADYYLVAATCEQDALVAIPHEKTRTRMIVARSLSWILWRHRKMVREMAGEATVSPVQVRDA